MQLDANKRKDTEERSPLRSNLWLPRTTYEKRHLMRCHGLCLRIRISDSLTLVSTDLFSALRTRKLLISTLSPPPLLAFSLTLRLSFILALSLSLLPYFIRHFYTFLGVLVHSSPFPSLHLTLFQPLRSSPSTPWLPLRNEVAATGTRGKPNWTVGKYHRGRPMEQRVLTSS